MYVLYYCTLFPPPSISTLRTSPSLYPLLPFTSHLFSSLPPFSPSLSHSFLRSPQSYHKRSIIANVCPAPFLKKPAQPHLLVCAPSNAGIDEIVRRLLEEGLVMNSQQWRLKQAEKVNEVVMAKWCASVRMCLHACTCVITYIYLCLYL